MEQSDLFYRNEAGRIVRLESFISLFPGRENGLKMLFGGEVLKSMDEISGNLATLFVGRDNHQARHGGSPQKPESFTLRYEGFGLCVILDTTDPQQHRMVQNLEPYNDSSSVAPIAREAIAFQKRTRNAL